jgi:hypothetical protein
MARRKAELVLSADEHAQHLHFIPTYSSWLNQGERFFALITERAIRRGSYPSYGLPQQIRSSKNSNVSRHELTGQDTSGPQTRALKMSPRRTGGDQCQEHARFRSLW